MSSTDSPIAGSPSAGTLSAGSLSEAQIDRMFRALADATRRDIMRRTLEGEASVSELARDYEMSFAAVQKHVAVLEAADLVSKIPRGRERIVRGNLETIRHARELLGYFEQIWRGRIQRLDDLLAADPAGAAASTDSAAVLAVADPDPAVATDPDLTDAGAHVDVGDPTAAVVTAAVASTAAESSNVGTVGSESGNARRRSTP